MEAVTLNRKKHTAAEKRAAFFLGYISMVQVWQNSPLSKDVLAYGKLSICKVLGNLMITFYDDSIGSKNIYESESLEDSFDLKVEALQHYWATGKYIDPLI